MWWEEFENRLTISFATIDREEGRVVYSDIPKLQTLNQKIKAGFLKGARVFNRTRKVQSPYHHNL